MFLQTLAGLPDQDSFYDVVDSLEEQGMEAVAQRHVNRKGTDLDLVEQFNIYEVSAWSINFSSGQHLIDPEVQIQLYETKIVGHTLIQGPVLTIN